MGKNEIKAVEMTRKIRDAHYEQLKGTSAEERIAFYKQKAQAVEVRMETITPGTKKHAAGAARATRPTG
jgi:hypothetical protein